MAHGENEKAEVIYHFCCSLIAPLLLFCALYSQFVAPLVLPCCYLPVVEIRLRLPLADPLLPLQSNQTLLQPYFNENTTSINLVTSYTTPDFVFD